MVFMSGVNAFAVNLSVYWVIGNTSALTYNIVGNSKFILTIIIGAVIFKEDINQAQMASILSILFGLICYSYFRIREVEAEKNKQAVAVVEEEVKPIDSASVVLNDD